VRFKTFEQCLVEARSGIRILCANPAYQRGSRPVHKRRQAR